MQSIDGMSPEKLDLEIWLKKARGYNVLENKKNHH